jgi:hypothetical protein
MLSDRRFYERSTVLPPASNATLLCFGCSSPKLDVTIQGVETAWDVEDL